MDLFSGYHGQIPEFIESVAGTAANLASPCKPDAIRKRLMVVSPL